MLKPGLRRGVYLSATFAVVAFLATLVLVVNLASHEANRFALRAQINTLHSEFERQLNETVRQQAEIAFWDETVRKLVLPAEPDEEFIDNELIDWIMADFGFSAMALVDSNGLVRFGVVGHRVIRDAQGLSLVRMNTDLVSLARKKYRDADLAPSRASFASGSNRTTAPRINATAIRQIGRQAGFVTAQVIIPDSEDIELDGRQEMVLLSFKPITAAVLGEMAKRLEFFDPRIVPAGKVRPEILAHLPLATPDIPASLAFVWKPVAPRIAILKVVAPFAGALCLVICVVLALIARRHAQTLRDLAASEARNRLMAYQDALTGLANRKCFDEKLNRLVSSKPARPFAVLCADLDRFKAVNDDHGHPAGDAVLKTVAQRFAASIGTKGMVARFGGDEFAAILMGEFTSEELQWIGDALVEAASEPVMFEGASLRVGASVGMAVAPAEGRDARTIMAAADKALYQSKRTGRGRISIAAPPIAPDLSALNVA